MGIDDMRAMQSNVTDFFAMKLLPYIDNSIKNMNMNLTEKKALEYLENWNFTAYTDSVGMTVYWYTLSYIYNLSFQSILDSNGLDLLPLPFVNTLIYLASNHPDSPWVNGNFTRLAEVSFSRAVSLLASYLGNNVSSWTWGRVHYLMISSITGLFKLTVKRAALAGFLIGFSTIIIYIIYPMAPLFKLSSILGTATGMPGIVLIIIYPLIYGLIMMLSALLFSDLTKR